MATMSFLYRNNLKALFKYSWFLIKYLLPFSHCVSFLSLTHFLVKVLKKKHSLHTPVPSGFLLHFFVTNVPFIQTWYVLQSSSGIISLNRHSGLLVISWILGYFVVCWSLIVSTSVFVSVLWFVVRWSIVDNLVGEVNDWSPVDSFAVLWFVVCWSKEDSFIG